ncbi:MAG: PilZ domain-containing protein [Candidatus Xenobia bacterium]
MVTPSVSLVLTRVAGRLRRSHLRPHLALHLDLRNIAPDLIARAAPERRRVPRHHCSFEVTGEALPGGRAMAHEIGANGMLIVTPAPLPLGHPLQLLLHLVEPLLCVPLRCRVSRTAVGTDGCSLGITFDSLTPSGAAIFQRYLESQPFA